MKSAITWTLAALAAAAIPNRTEAQSQDLAAETGVQRSYSEERANSAPSPGWLTSLWCAKTKADTSTLERPF